MAPFHIQRCLNLQAILTTRAGIGYRWPKGLKDLKAGRIGQAPCLIKGFQIAFNIWRIPCAKDYNCLAFSIVPLAIEGIQVICLLDLLRAVTREAKSCHTLPTCWGRSSGCKERR